jgi:Uma2 family endonuclease
MTGVTVGYPGGRGPLTVDDLDQLPDDGRRQELLDGTLMISPVPDIRHQIVLSKLMFALDKVCPDTLHILPGPLAVRPSIDTELRPDLLAARHEDVGAERLTGAPVLVVEVLSPNTELIDRHTKKAAYQRMGVASYWIVDPLEPRLTEFELDAAGSYVQFAEAKGEDVFQVERPFPVRIVPTDLLGKLRHR